MAVKKCPICGAVFETNRANKKYCSITCKEAGQLLRRIQWEQANPEYNKNYMKKYRQKQGGKT